MKHGNKNFISNTLRGSMEQIDGTKVDLKPEGLLPLTNNK